jgi:competence protein ComEC
MEPDSALSGKSSAAPKFAGADAIPLSLAACLFALGIIATQHGYVPAARILASITALIILCVIASLRAQRVAWIAMSLVWVLLGAWCAEMEPQPSPVPALLALSDGLMRTVEGTVTNAGPIRSQIDQGIGEPGAELPSQSIDLHLASIEVADDLSDQQVPIIGSVRLNLRWPNGNSQRIPCGARIRAAARLLPPEVYHDAGVWNRATYLLDQGITSTASVNMERVELLAAPQSISVACRVHEAQHALVARILALPGLMHNVPAPLRLTQDDAAMLSAMVTGDRTFLNHSLRVGFERTGSFHMLVVSGLHLAIVAGCILGLARRLRLPQFPATLITIAASFAYALLTGFATPVQRSFWMVTLYLVGRLLFRDRNVLNTIGFAALCLMVVSPRALFDSSLQMTLLAVIAIGGIAVPYLGATVHPYFNATRNLRRVAIDIKLAPALAQFRVTLRMVAARLNRLANRRMAWQLFPWTVRFFLRVVEALVVSLAIELAMMLPMAVWFHRITLFALPVNLLILPLLLLLMPVALVTCVLLLIWPGAAILSGMLVALLLHFGAGMVHLFGSLRWGDLRLAEPALWQHAAFWALLAGAIVIMRAPHRSARISAWCGLFLAGLVAIAPRAMQHPRDALFVEAIDVGQGDSILLITPEGKTLLVDGGGFGGGPRHAVLEFDIGEEVVSATLWSRGIHHLDAVALTHAHSDHMGGLPAILRNFHPAELWVGNNPPVADYQSLLNEARQLHINLRRLMAGDSVNLGAAQIQALAPFGDYVPAAEPGNNDSLVLRAAYGATSVLLEGDAEAPVERAMLSESNLESTLLKVGHHGSRTSTMPEFLARVAPQWAVISCGLHNRYGHPRAEVLRELQSAGVRTFSTDIHGAACFRLDGKSVLPDPSCAGANP